MNEEIRIDTIAFQLENVLTFTEEDDGSTESVSFGVYVSPMDGQRVYLSFEKDQAYLYGHTSFNAEELELSKTSSLYIHKVSELSEDFPNILGHRVRWAKAAQPLSNEGFFAESKELMWWGDKVMVMVKLIGWKSDFYSPQCPAHLMNKEQKKLARLHKHGRKLAYTNVALVVGCLALGAWLNVPYLLATFWWLGFGVILAVTKTDRRHPLTDSAEVLAGGFSLYFITHSLDVYFADYGQTFEVAHAAACLIIVALLRALPVRGLFKDVNVPLFVTCLISLILYTLAAFIGELFDWGWLDNYREQAGSMPVNLFVILHYAYLAKGNPESNIPLKACEFEAALLELQGSFEQTPEQIQTDAERVENLSHNLLIAVNTSECPRVFGLYPLKDSLSQIRSAMTSLSGKEEEQAALYADDFETLAQDLEEIVHCFQRGGYLTIPRVSPNLLLL